MKYMYRYWRNDANSRKPEYAAGKLFRCHFIHLNPTCNCLGSNTHLMMTVHRSTHFDLFRPVMIMCYTSFRYVNFEKFLDESENLCRVSHHIYVYCEKPLAPRPIPNWKSSVISRPALLIQSMQFARTDNTNRPT